MELSEKKAINPTSVEVTFNKAVEALAKADVTVTNKETNVKQLVKSVELSKDGKSATVEFYDALTAGDYKVAVTDAGEATLTYAVGVPTTIVAETAQKFDASKTGKVAYKVLDEKGLDITATLKASEVTFQSTDSNVVDNTGAVKATTTAKSAFVNIIVKKEGSTTELKSERITVTTEVAGLKEITDYTVGASADFTSPTYKQNTKIALGDSKKLFVTGKDQYGETASTTGAKFESLDLDVAVIDATTGAITPIKEGKFAVKVTVGNVTKTVELEVVATAKLTSLEADKESVTLSNEATVPAKVKVVAKDQNDADFTTADYTADYTADATTEAGKALVNVTLKADGTIEVSPKSKAAGTATIEVKHKTDSTIKTVFTVTVEKASAVADFKVVGFEAKLDKFADNTAKTPSTATLSVIPVDANGAQAGAIVTNDEYIVTDKDGKTVENAVKNNEIDAAKLPVGKYTLTTKVGTVVVATQEFEVVNTETQPTIEFTATTVTNTNDDNLFEEVKNAIKVIPGTTAQETDNIAVKGIKFVSTDSTIVESKTDAFATAITVKKDGKADLLISEVQLQGDTGEPYIVKLNSNFKLTVNSDFVKVSAETALINELKTTNISTTTPVKATGNFLDITSQYTTVDGTTLTVDFDKTNTKDGIKALYSALDNIDEGKVNGKDAKEYAIDRYVMNTFARYMGSIDTNLVKEIQFNGKTYKWDVTKSPVSKWYDGETSLVSAVVLAENTAIRDVTFKVVDANEYSVDGTFKANNVPAVSDIEFSAE